MFGAYAPGQGYFADSPIGAPPQPATFDVCGSYVASVDAGASYVLTMDAAASYVPAWDHAGSTTGD